MPYAKHYYECFDFSVNLAGSLNNYDESYEFRRRLSQRNSICMALIKKGLTELHTANN